MGKESPMPDFQITREAIRAVLADAAIAFIVGLIAALVIASLAAAGIITLGLAYTLLFLAWVAAIGGSFIMPWEISSKHRSIFGIFLAIMLGSVGWFEAENYEKPPSAKEIASEVSEILSMELSDHKKTLGEQPDVALRFVYSTSPALVLVNQSAAIAREIKWEVAIWNLDDPRTFRSVGHETGIHDPLPIPSSTFDFLRPHISSGPLELFNAHLATFFIKNGQHLFGTASVICPLCVHGHTYIINIIWGDSGWYVEALNSKEGELLIPQDFKKETVANYYRTILAQTPESARIPIQDK